MNSRDKSIIIIGLLMTVIPPIVLASIFGNKEVPGNIAFLMPILGGLIPLLGIILLVRGYVKNKPNAFQVQNKTVLSLAKDRPHLSWIGWFVATFIFIASAIVQWQNSTFVIDYPRPWVPFLFVAIFAAILLTSKLLNRQKSLVTILIGDLGLDPKDEREAVILQRAGQQALASSFVIFGILIIVLLTVPRPSDFALLDLFLTIVMLQRGLYSFFAWRMGLK